MISLMYSKTPYHPFSIKSIHERWEFPDFFQGDFVVSERNLLEKWNDGIVEYWNDGLRRRKKFISSFRF